MTQRMMWIHGWGMSPAAWQGLQDSLPEYEHHMIDFGSCETPESFRDALAAALKAGDDQDKASRWYLVGWSMGGLLALDVLLTEERAPHIGKILLIGTTLCFTEQDRRLGWSTRVLERMKRNLQKQPEETLAEFRWRCLSTAERNGFEGGGLPLPLQDVKPDCSIKGLAAGLDYLRNTDLKCHVNQLVKQDRMTLPDMLWIHGEDDLVCPVGNLASVTSWEEAGLLQKVILSGAGHVPFLTQRQKVMDIMKEFFRND